jgi:hypothetical protein
MLKNRPLTWDEKRKLHPNYIQIIQHYERVTKRSFMRDELIVLKLMVEKAYPAQIIQTISRFYKLHPERFTSLHYIYRPVCNMFKNKRGGKK